MSRAAIVLLSSPGLETARRIKSALGDAEIWGLQGRVKGTDRPFTETAATLQRLYDEGTAIIGLCAAGILIRSLAPSLTDKRGEPPVLAVSDDGRAIVPLLGGLTGANELARRLAAALEGEAAITASGSRRYGLQLESPPAGYVLANPEDAKAVTATLLGGAGARIEGQASWLSDSGLPIDANGSVFIRVSPYCGAAPDSGLLYRPRIAAAFVDGAQAIGANDIRTALEVGDIAEAALGAILLSDGAEPTPSLREAAAGFGCPIRFIA
ncbi:MAG: precorrin-3B C(17)-methyltransferase, partial [Methyloligellaceae bacterium]